MILKLSCLDKDATQFYVYTFEMSTLYESLKPLTIKISEDKI